MAKILIDNRFVKAYYAVNGNKLRIRRARYSQSSPRKIKSTMPNTQCGTSCTVPVNTKQLMQEHDKAMMELIRWRTLGEALIEGDPNDMAADGVTCLMVWKKAAEDLLKG